MAVHKKYPALGRGLDALISTKEVHTDGSSTINEIELDKISPNPNQPRRDFDPESLRELAASIAEIGIVQPITLRKMEDDTFQIIAGERRWRASKQAGLHTIPAYIRTADDENVMEMALISGRIKIQTCSDPSRVVYLKPNEKALFNKESGIITVEKTDNRFETAWLRGDLVFRSTKLSDVLAKLERRYGVKFHLIDFSLAYDLFTGNFDSEYIVEVMDLLERHYDFTYDIRGDDIFIHP